MRIASLRGLDDIRGAQPRSELMQWFEATARAMILAIIVLIGAAVVRNVTEALTVATHGPSLARTASLTVLSR